MFPRNWSDGRAAAAAAIAGFVVRAALALSIHNVQYSDSVWYDATAANLARSGIYGPIAPSAWFPPGYPGFLALVYTVFGHAPLAGRLANAALGGVTTALVFFIARTVFSRRVAAVASVLVAVWPNLVFHSLILDSESLCAALFCAALAIATRPASEADGMKRDIALGLILAWAALTRPVAVILVPVIAIWWVTHKVSPTRAARRLAVVLTIAAAPIAMWSARNHLRFGELILVATNGGYNFWQANNRYANGTDTFWAAVPPGLPEFEQMRTGDEFTRNRLGYQYGRAFLADDPYFPIRMLPAKAFWIYHTDTSGLYEAVLYAREASPSAVAAWIVAHRRLSESLTYRFYFFMMLLMAAAPILASSRRTELIILGTLPVLLILFHAMFHAKDRFHVPLIPVIALLAASAVVSLVDALRARAFPVLQRA